MSAANLFAPPMASVHVATGSRRSSASFYDILRVKNNASSVEIKTAYRSLAKIYHPDSARKSDCDSFSSDDGCSFLEIHNAYETLSDPATRAHYDLALAALTRRAFLRSRSRPHRRWETDQCW
ncbi:Chaperone protein dnaJ 11, chloroplastic, partial [Cucurbita argyrosperma subsp. argyrosperma]|uniref:Chaperone protein dnaJ 11, chloroplastic-like n=2 Tax=Cucurbita TaxID=3660 RepID=A0A6J1FQ67_CUCMO